MYAFSESFWPACGGHDPPYRAIDQPACGEIRERRREQLHDPSGREPRVRSTQRHVRSGLDSGYDNELV